MMKFGIPWWCLAAGLVCAVAGRTRAEEPALPAEEIIRRTVERSESADEREARMRYSFHKRVVTEQMDGKGKVTERKEKLYDVLVRAGVPKETLVQIDGKTPPPKVLRKQAERDAAERASYSPDPAKDKEKDKGRPRDKHAKKQEHAEKLATEELTARFHFTRRADEVVAGRPTFVLDFEPKPGKLPEKELTDRFLNHMAGRVWIDAAEFEVARADLRLLREITVWGGVLGKLRRCDFTFTQAREPDGLWVENLSTGVFEGRKLLDTLAVRFRSEATDYQRLPDGGND